MEKGNKYQALVDSIPELFGGKENISHLTHCVTRLRFTFKDNALVKTKEIEELPAVLGTQWSGSQFQVIIGGGVDKAYDQICNKYGITQEAAIDENLDEDLTAQKPKGIKGVFSSCLDAITAILSPSIPAIVACGLVQGILFSLQIMGIASGDSPTYNFFLSCAQAAFYFLPVLIGFSAGQRFKMDPILAAATCGILILPAFSGQAGTTIKLFGFLPLTFSDYSSTIVPAILTVYFESFVYKWCKKHVPDMIDIILTPLITVMASAVVSWVLLAPLGGWIGTGLVNVIYWVYMHLGVVGGAICGAIYPFMLMTGMQVATVPIIAQNLATLGYDFLYPVLDCASNSAMAACALYIGVKAKKEKTKSMGVSTGITALIGVTEPVLFGLITKYRKALISTIVGGACGGAVMALFKVKYLSFGFVPFGTIVLAVTDTFPFYLLGVAVSMIVAVIMMKVLKWSDVE